MKRVLIIVLALCVVFTWIKMLTGISLIGDLHGWRLYEIDDCGVPRYSAVVDRIAFDSSSDDDGFYRRERFNLRYDGFMVVSNPRKYSFRLISDDGSNLFIDDRRVVDNSGEHTVRVRTGDIELSPGVHSIRVDYFNKLNQAALRVEYYQGNRWEFLTSDRVYSKRIDNKYLRFLYDTLYHSHTLYRLALPYLLMMPFFAGSLLLVRKIFHDRDTGILCLFFLVAVFLCSSPRIASDGYGYFAYLPSILFDGDLHFADEFCHKGPGYAYNLSFLTTPPTATGAVRNYWSVGPAILWLPFYAVSLLGNLAGRPLNPDLPINGMSLFQVLAVGFASSFYGVGTLVLTGRCWKRFCPDSRPAEPLILLCLGTPLFHYAFKETSFAHAPSAFAVATYVTFWLFHRQSRRIRDWMILGGLGALMTLTYWQNALLLVMGGGDLLTGSIRSLFRKAPGKTGRFDGITRLAVYSATLLAGITPQLIVWKYLFGHYLTIPQGSTFVLCGNFYLLEVLFSSYHGLFTWTPMVLASLIGFFAFGRRRFNGAWPYMLAALLLFFLHSFLLQDWYGGGGFGIRRSANIFVLLAFGFMMLYRRYGANGFFRMAVIACAVWTQLMIVVYNVGFNTQDSFGELVQSVRELRFSSVSKVLLSPSFREYFNLIIDKKFVPAALVYILFYTLMLATCVAISFLLFRAFSVAEPSGASSHREQDSACSGADASENDVNHPERQAT